MPRRLPAELTAGVNRGNLLSMPDDETILAATQKLTASPPRGSGDCVFRKTIHPVRDIDNARRSQGITGEGTARAGEQRRMDNLE